MNIPSRNFSKVFARLAASLFALGVVSSTTAASLTVEIKGAIGDKGTVK